jgi:hypothetical protein
MISDTARALAAYRSYVNHYMCITAYINGAVTMVIAVSEHPACVLAAMSIGVMQR